MSRIAGKKNQLRVEAEPTWDVAHLFPLQGAWTEGEYLALDTNHPIELSGGHLVVLPMPTNSHQVLLLYLYGLLSSFVGSHDLGEVRVSALPVRLWRERFREPDILFMLKAHEARIREEYWIGADLVMEIVSAGAENRRRDFEEKRRDYARARISEYWIVDPQEERITVLRLSRTRYAVHGEFGKGMIATSHLLPGFTVDVTEAFAKQRRTRKTQR